MPMRMSIGAARLPRVNSRAPRITAARQVRTESRVEDAMVAGG